MTSLGQYRGIVERNRARLDFSRTIIWKSKSLLNFSCHISNNDCASHICNPGLLGDRLQMNEIPELPLVHADFGNFVFKYPIAQNTKSGLIWIHEHSLGQRFPHELASLIDSSDVPSPPGITGQSVNRRRIRFGFLPKCRIAQFVTVAGWCASGGYTWRFSKNCLRASFPALFADVMVEK
jgi:hypothetical protein